MTDSARFKFSAPWLLSEGVWYITVQFVTLIAKADLFDATASDGPYIEI